MRFTLGGLLRVRGVQERAAAADRSRTETAAEDARRAVRRAQERLGVGGDEVTDARSLMATSAARAAARAALQDLRAAEALAAEAHADACAAHVEAKREVRAIEKLEGRARREEAARDGRNEQSALDEIAVNAAAEDRRSR
ncbi:flagellar FliJ family protein [Microbacterium suaedae]|uniref:flagellar FliJ family protein n=1 Tax=Microbacterium suaedae TaxID=2067813 RepID=UPI000DA20DB1|nr:flagellar FliJ family protein [Microbacterium suaedae]